MLNNIRNIYAFRELLINLTVKELKLKYKNSVFGFVWSFLNPLLMLMIYTFAFKMILKVPIENFGLFVFAGLAPWLFLQGAVTHSANSLISNGNLIKKVYFPREIIPLSIVGANLFNYLIISLVLIVATLIIEGGLTLGVLLYPLGLSVLFLLTSGLSLLVSSLTVRYRDLAHLVEVFFTVFFYLTPIIYSVSLIPKDYQVYVLANPLTGLVDLHRAIYLGYPVEQWWAILLTAAIAVLVFVVGYTVFKAREAQIAEES